MTADGRRSWSIYRGSNQPTPPEERRRWLETAPPWRGPRCDARSIVRREPGADVEWRRRGETYISSGAELEDVNVALLLRRPLLVTGDPGLGKSSLAYSIAHCLGLGAPLRWEIGSRTTLEEGLYRYDAVEHLRATRDPDTQASVGSFITLGPLGTALLPTALPRVLLIDELDKASYDLPNDLLHVLEEAALTIRELLRVGGTQHVYPWDSRGQADTVPVIDGRVHCYHHPVVVITSNGEREFPPAFQRRCVRLVLSRPKGDHLEKIVEAQLGSLEQPIFDRVMEKYHDRTTDELLQRIFLEKHGVVARDGSLGVGDTTGPGAW